MENSNLSYYFILTVSYGVALLTWWIILHYSKKQILEDARMSKAWLQVAGLLVCTVVTILIGRLYIRGHLVPGFQFYSWNISESINQILIYSPFPLFLVITRQGMASAWLSTSRIYIRVVTGFGLSILATITFVLLSGQRNIIEVILDVYHLKNLHHLIQIFMEDFAVVLFLSRLANALGSKYFTWSAVVIGVLFSFGHVPNDLGGAMEQSTLLANRILDAGLLTGVGLLLYKSRDFLWFWPIHFAMDMMQFYSGTSYH